MRMGGQGEFADLIRKRFAIAWKRLGINTDREPGLDTTLFKPPSVPSTETQLNLFR